MFVNEYQNSFKMTNNLLLRLPKLIILALVVMLFTQSTSDPSFNDGELYQLNFEDNSTYTVNCYSVLSHGKWEVKNNCCTLTTSIINLPGVFGVDQNMDVPLNATFFGTGNLEAPDKVVIEYSIGASWQLVAEIIGGNIPTGHPTSGFRAENIPAGADIQFRLIFCTNEQSEKITLLSDNEDGHVHGQGLFVGSPFYRGSNVTYVPGQLPVSLVSFYGIAEKEKMNLFWETASESNNSHFELERSIDGEEFKIVTTIQGSGNSNSRIRYSTEDYEPIKGTSYYRLKQVDFDGKFAYSNLISLSSLVANNACNLIVKPNPCMGKCFIYLEDCDDQNGNEMTFSMYDALGNVVNTQTKTVEEGKSLFAVDLNSSMKPGVYIVRGSSNNKNINNKAIITN